MTTRDCRSVPAPDSRKCRLLLAGLGLVGQPATAYIATGKLTLIQLTADRKLSEIDWEIEAFSRLALEKLLVRQ